MRAQLSILARRLSASTSVTWRGAAAGSNQSFTSSARAEAENAEAPQTMANVDVPAGHENSDMRNNVCNISLNRRRDISLRTDVNLFCNRDDEPINLKELLRTKNLDEVRSGTARGDEADTACRSDQ